MVRQEEEKNPDSPCRKGRGSAYNGIRQTIPDIDQQKGPLYE
jgi:hypothetical protein